MELIKIKNLIKKYQDGETKKTVLDNINLNIKESEIITILGPSGSGKTTLLNIISGLEKADNGQIIYKKEDITNYNERKLTNFRRKNIGFIFQNYNLLEHLNVYENILVGSSLSKNALDIDQIITSVDLQKQKNKSIYKLSGGEQQRISIARALVKNPRVLFCDEPTGALDEKNGKAVLDKIVNINNVFKTTIIIITHNPAISLISDRIIKMNSGKIIEIKKNKRMSPKEIPWG